MDFSEDIFGGPPEIEAGFSSADRSEIEKKTRKNGDYLFDHLQSKPTHILQRRWWDDRIMAWTMRDEKLKVQLFRFVDVLPMLADSEAIVQRLVEYLDLPGEHLPMSARVALGVARRTPFTRAAVARAARLSAMDFARRFIAGTNTREVLEAAQRERKQNRGFTLDILGEAVASEVEAERYYRAYIDLIESVAPTVNAWPEVPQIDCGVMGELPRVNLSIKLSALDSQFDAIDPQGARQCAGERLRGLLRVARRNKAFINVDMESYDKKDLTLKIFKEILLEDEFRDIGDVGIVIQCYLTDSAVDLMELRDWAVRRGKPVWVRLVKGAYWDHETIHAQQHGWPIPVYQKKYLSDANFERATRFLMKNYKHLRPALGTHNLRSIAHGIAVAEHLELPDNGFELQMLHGMADAEKHALVELGCRLRIYMPYGQLIPGMAYLVRRLLENTSNESFLRAGFVENVSPDILLQNPIELHRKLAAGREEQKSDAAATAAETEKMEISMSDSLAADAFAPIFQNHPPVDFAKEENRQAMQQALGEVRQKLGGFYPLVINGEKIETEIKIESRDPALKQRIVGYVASADKSHVEKTAAAAQRATADWAALGAEKRAETIRRAAEIMRERFFELCAWEVYECGKGWREAAGDVCEAIDFCGYYAAGAIAMEQPRGVNLPGEENQFQYAPRGVAAVIAPWNFPLAILTGMTTAALATGNTVIMKPAEQATVMAALLMEIFSDAGLPPGALHYLPGPGREVGEALVEHPDVALIAFTGSRQVGLAINVRAAEVSAQGLPMVKRVIAEMGGKNAIIIDSDADLDEAVLGVVKSAFGFQGQKCSACSRVIVLDAVYDTFLTRLVEATRSLKVGPPEDPSSSVGPVISEQAQQSIKRYIELGRQEGREVLSIDVGDLAQQGYFVGPHIFADVSSDAGIAQEEIFGPVVAVIRAKDLDEAIQIANGTDYALTGGMYSRSPANLQRGRRELLVGNLYLNREITGAMVGRQPFGGFKMSGIGSKAGGPEYLLQFVLPRTITENTVRRGFAPSSSDKASS